MKGPGDGAGVAAHVDTARLLASPADGFDVRNARLVDGRAVHHYLQFIEPELVRLVPPARRLGSPAVPKGSLLEGGVSPANLAARSLEGTYGPLPREAPVFAIDGLVDVPIWTEAGGVLLPGSERHVKLAGESIEYVARVGLGFFTELAVGAIVVRDEGREAPHHCVVHLTAARGGPEERATALLEQAAGEFLWQWYLVERRLNTGAEEEGRPEALAALQRVFSRSVACELWRRAGLGGEERDRQRRELVARAPEMLEFLSGYPDTPLTQELAACWFPGWRRSLFIFNSPFDHIRELMPRGSDR